MEKLTAFKSVQDELTVQSDNILLRDHRIILPASLRDRAIRIAHEGHQGMAKTKSFIRSKIWFPGIDSKVETAVRDCMPCQIQHRKQEWNHYGCRNSLQDDGENVSVDFCGPLTTREYLMVLVDEFSQYPCVELLRSVSTPVLDKVFSTFCTPRTVKSDNRSPFNSEAFRKYALNQGFNHRRITPRWSRANAQAESFNKPLMKVVRAAHYEKKNWRQVLFGFLRQYRTTPHSTTGQTPYRLMFGREPRTKMPQVAERQQNALHEQVRERDSKRKCQMKLYADARNHAKDSDISVGDVVVVQQDMKGNKLTTAFDPQPRTVTNMKGPMITVHGKTTRNVSRFKKINQCPGKGQQSKQQFYEEIEELKEDSEAGKPVNTP
ncbi:uncharacterized protein LOC110466305 [Mizuhopecten yessoensis]|uniref:uncharacterized protein LOC110466305 n=1 Tax=Mizuhopecten yessoensis TaxID=6573 RepID=UPI000B4580CB|nr:uncharacterized protein LOC110466305 [Mizuhopecten yessoensis]